MNACAPDDARSSQCSIGSAPYMVDSALMDWQELISAARTAREHAYAPYSGFAVGAALRTRDGHIFAGCNVENRSLGATVCAERVAVGSAVAAGQRRLEALLVITETVPPATPCGLCLQVLMEFAGPELRILVMNTAGEHQEYRLTDLHPHPFELPDEGLGRKAKD